MGNISELFEHVQRYTREIFAERLREEGFSSYKGQDIHWYRLVNGEVVHAVYFVTQHTALGSLMDIMYGCHPLFVPPVFQKSPYLSGWPGYEQMNGCIPEIIPGSTRSGFLGTAILGESNRPYRFPDVLIMCPDNMNNGLDILDRILPVMDDLVTPITCYEMHKRVRKGEIEYESTTTMSSYFVDEVLYFEDQELYPYCRKYAEHQAWSLENLPKNGIHLGKKSRQPYERGAVLNRVFEERSFQEYLQTFPRRAQETLRLLEKNAGIRRDI